MPGTLLLLVVWYLAGSSLGHLCLLSPKQRGALDISVGGSPTCFRQGAPCGGQGSEMPTTVLYSGSTAFIKWQQNLNHYEPGFPGYMDIALAPSTNSTDFTILAVATDRYEHAQLHQRNYTAEVKIPMMTCEHCVLRARYNAHKPGETTFYQCADVMIKPRPSGQTLPQSRSTARPQGNLWEVLQHRNGHKAHIPNANINDTKLYGFAYNPYQPGKTSYLSVSTTTGITQKLNELDFGIDSYSDKTNALIYERALTQKRNLTFDKMGPFLLDEVITIDYLRNTTQILVHDTGTRDTPAMKLYNIGTEDGSVVESASIAGFDQHPINAITWYTYKNYLTFSIEEVRETPGFFNFVLGLIDDSNKFTKLAQIDQPEGLYTNFLWLENGFESEHVYALMGHEHAPETLNARIYTFDPSRRLFISMVDLIVSEYTFMSIHAFPGRDNVLYAFSPGLMSDSVATWSLVAVDPYKGIVTKHCDIAPPGVFQRFYGGSVFSGAYNTDMELYHVLRVANSDADVIVSVDPRSCRVSFSDLTSLRHIHNLARPCALDNPNHCFYERPKLR